ncbi:hypothetical protein KRR26_31420 [Corallococcus sp. M34]|uniref:hypothetical protein n=1 Tax=Citreicoccus inhibens TaxID=2849499 RepID=UPI001C214C23|nr:hypothetical protein [Citreicoccus inhibens]MBU8900125.1 hypothetical protein [Citreicoccus inhibens]
MRLNWNPRPGLGRLCALVCALAAVACGDMGAPAPEETPDDTVMATAQPLAFSSPMSFDELRGLPLAPSTLDMTVQDLLRVLPSPRFDDLRGVLSTKHQPADKVRLVSAYARDYPVFLKGNQALLPNADGVFATQSPVITWDTLGGGACSTSHACAKLYEPTTELQDYAAIVIVAPRVELAGAVETGGTSLIIATGEFDSHDFPLRTSPGVRDALPDPPDGTVAPSGRNGRNAGQFVLYANVLRGVRVNATGEKGEDGKDGKDGQASGITTTLTGSPGPTPTVTCKLGSMVKLPQSGGNGGAAGRSGDIIVRYTGIVGRGLVREPQKSAYVTPEQCFTDSNLHCQSLKCRWNPSIALCDMLTEADNAQCSDGIDNDHNGYTDCDDYACSKNPHVTVCPESSWSQLQKEVSAEACSDGVDNDGDGKVDCADPQCSVRSICQSSHVANGEFSEQACSNGIDDDGDGYTDCQDNGCKASATNCGGSGEGGEDKCADGLDNDNDGLPDCEDPGCSGTATCNLGPAIAFTSGMEESTEAACQDGLDNDLDGDIDCADRECQVNPRVTSCGSERTLQNCTDGIDNDGDGKVDCADPGCANNPYVKVCDAQYYPFLQESTTATCTDGLDNDGDHYVDCADYQCLNNPLVAVSACGIQENTFAACSDGVDNDGDGKVDCADDNCAYNPFYGDLLCRSTVQTGHDVSLSSPYNGHFTDLAAEFINPAPAVGRYGKRGNRASITVPVIVQEAPTGSCEFYDDYLCQPHNETRTCYVGPSANNGTAGATGTPGAQKTLRVARRDVDMLRALLAPQTWRVSAAHGNALFKRGELPSASFQYTQAVMEMSGILSQAKLDCDVAPTGKPFPDVYLHGALCPILRHDVTKLSYIQSQRNFFGLAKDMPLNPHVRYEQRRTQFNTLYSVLDSSVSKWLTLSNSLQLTAWMTQHQGELNNEVIALAADLATADQRVTVASESANALQTAIANRKAAIDLLTTDIQTTDARIKEKYAAQTKGFGDFLLDLVGSVASAYGGQFLAAVAGKAADALWNEVKNSFKSESSSTPVPGSGPASHDDNSLLSGLWDALSGAAADAAKSKPFKDKLKTGGTQLWDIISGNQKTAPRSVISDEVKKEILSQSQVEMTLDLLDLQAQVTKAQAEYKLAMMERDTVLLRQRNAVAARDALQSIVDFGTGTELRGFDQLLVGQQVYSTATRTLDELIYRYWELIRVAEYQYLPFDPATGDSAIPTGFLTTYDFNLLTYPDMQTKLVALDDLPTHTVQSQTLYYRRVPATSFHALTVDETTRMKDLGSLTTAHPTLVGARFQVTTSDLAATPALAARNGHRVRNVRVNLVTDTGAPVSVDAFLVRDTVDAFQMGTYVAEFELVDVDRFPNGNPRSVLHYIPFTACVSTPPVCNVADPSCATPFQNAAFSDTCSVAPSGSTPDNNSFYDRSLLGEWMLVMDASSYTALGTVRAAEVVFQATGTPI